MQRETEFHDIQIEPQTNPKIQSATMYLLVNHTYLINHRYYSRFISDNTELWIFGCGLGEQAVAKQMGNAFLEYCKENDPCLGKIMLSLGQSATSFYPYKGDVDLWWAWSDHANFIPEYYGKTTVKPQILLCTSHRVEEEAEQHGLETVYLPLATGKDFKPLGLERKGLGYTGNPNKPNEQYHIMIEPFIHQDFEWITKNRDDIYLKLEQLNTWYNTRQIVFGMIAGHCKILHIIPNRMFETLASGTPFITGRYDLEDVFSFPYPFMTDSQDETINLVAEILADYPKYLVKFAEYSRNIRENHTFDIRIKTLMEYLKK